MRSTSAPSPALAQARLDALDQHPEVEHDVGPFEPQRPDLLAGDQLDDERVRAAVGAVPCLLEARRRDELGDEAADLPIDRAADRRGERAARGGRYSRAKSSALTAVVSRSPMRSATRRWTSGLAASGATVCT